MVGNELRLTPLTKLMKPPPLSHRQINLESFACHVDMYGHSLVALMNNGKLLFVEDVAKPARVIKETEFKDVLKLNLLKYEGQFYISVFSNIEGDRNHDDWSLYTMDLVRIT